ncbi:peptidoglycan bridge formation glycyltransferase FemA/FemB family protein [candidate division KSB1 bacterium]|nr:peptidoglycan bridge formation glycyltransferase FemA/FemB family protein [candidate division KSB1 bacterium]
MSLIVKKYTETDRGIWENYIKTSNNGTIFHRRKFLDYHPPMRFKDSSLLFYKENKLLAVCPAVDITLEDRRMLISHRGASYGGLVVHDNLSIKDAFDLVQALTKYAREKGFQGVDLTPPPQIYLNRPSNYIDFAMVQSGFVYRKREISSVIPLDIPQSRILDSFSTSSRRAVRRAEKLGVVVRECDLYEEFYKILQKNLRLRHNVSPTHSIDELLSLVTIFPNDIKLYAAFYQQTMVAGVVMFVCNPQVVLAFYISHDEEYQQYRGVNKLFYEIVHWGLELGFKFLDFGIFTVNEDPNWGLARFKESFGAQGVFRDSLQLVF